MNDQRFIYAVSDGEFLKVGFAKDVHKRLRGLQTSSPRQLTVIRCVRVPQWKLSTARLLDAKNYEKSLHKALRTFAVRGEWFSMGALDAFDEFWRQRQQPLSHPVADSVGRPLQDSRERGVATHAQG